MPEGSGREGGLAARLGIEGERERLLAKAALVAVPVILVFALLAFSPLNIVRIVIIGLQAGAVYSLVGLGIALIYKATKVLNFAQGEFGTAPAFLAYLFFTRGDIEGGLASQPGPGEMFLATLAAVAFGAIIAILINVLIVQRLAETNQVTALVATVGVSLAFISAQVMIFEARARRFPQYVEGSPCFGPQTGEGASFGLCPLTVGGITVAWHTVIVLIVLAIAATVLALFFRTRTGVALLATSQEPFAAQLQGVSVRGMATLAWGTAGALAALGGILGAGNFQQLTPGLVTGTFLIPAFTGAVLGGLTSMVGAVVGGLLLGIVVSFANSAVLAYDLTAVLPGPPQIATMVVLLLVLLLRPRGLFGKEA